MILIVKSKFDPNIHTVESLKTPVGMNSDEFAKSLEINRATLFRWRNKAIKNKSSNLNIKTIEKLQEKMMNEGGRPDTYFPDSYPLNKTIIRTNVSTSSGDASLPGQKFVIGDVLYNPDHFPYYPTSPTVPYNDKYPLTFNHPSKIPTFEKFIERLKESYEIDKGLPFADMILERCDGLNGKLARDKSTVKAVFHLMKILF